MQKYYTLQISYMNPDPKPGQKEAEKLVVEFKDYTNGDQSFFAWSRDIRRNLFTAGFQVQTADKTFMLIPPPFIFYVLLIEQDKKYGV